MRQDMCPGDTTIFLASVDEHLNQVTNLTAVEDWIRSAKPAIEASKKRAVQRGMATMLPITQYFT